MSIDLVERLRTHYKPRCRICLHHNSDMSEVTDLLRAAADEIERLKQMMWDAYRVLGFDTDGQPTYHATVGWPDSVFPAAMAEARSDYDEALAENSHRTTRGDQ